MIPVQAVVALFLFMIACVAFGWALGRISRKFDFKEPEEKESHACDTCKYDHVKPQDEPCRSCLVDDIDRWERDDH